MKNLILVTLALLLLSILGSCAPELHTECVESLEVYGFWSGFLHGWISTFAFIGNLCGGYYEIYSVVNNGNWYDFGYILGIGSKGSLVISGARR